MPKQTASNTIGPFFHHILTPEGHGKTGITDNKLAGKKTTTITINKKVAKNIFNATLMGVVINLVLFE